MNPPVDWLLEGEPYIAYRTRLDLLDQPADHPDVLSARAAMLAMPQVQAILAELAGWPGGAITNHKAAGALFHKLSFLADLGLQAADPGMQPILDKVMAHPSEQGSFQVLLNIPTHFGGSGTDTWAWILCDTPTVLYALARFGLQQHPAVQAAAAHLAAVVRPTGWPCAGSPEISKFRGPGRKEDPCPIANLAVLKALAALPEWHDSGAYKSGAEALLSLWQNSQSQHPYLFNMGTDFRKLKAPFIWYDLLHVLEVLTQFPHLHTDPRLQDMLSVLRAGMDPEGRFTAGSVWTAWKDWNFGQKKQPSRWITLLAWRILRRVNGCMS